MSTLRIGNLFSRTVSQFFREPKVRREVCAIASACGGGSEDSITSVNGDTGPDVVLTAADVGAATAAQGALADSALQSVVAGDNITVDNTDPANPIISSTGGGTELTAGSGLNIDSGQVVLGLNASTIGSTNEGLITKDTYILRGDLLAQDYVGILFDQVTDANSDELGLSAVYNSSSAAYISTTRDLLNEEAVVQIRRFDITGTANQMIRLTSNSISITDDVNSKGLIYNADYSTNGVTDPRWIPDYGAVQALVAGVDTGVEGITGVQVDNTDPVNPVINAPTWAQVTGKPTTFTPAAHNQAFTTITGVATDAQIPSLAISKITGLQSAIDGKIDTGVGATVPDTAEEAAGETPTKEEFDALLAELRALKAAL